MNRRAPVIALASAALLAAGGCSSYAPPVLSVTDARMTEVTEDGVLLEFDLQAAHANAEPIPLETIRYNLRVDGRRAFSGQRAALATLSPAREDSSSIQTITLPAVVPLELLPEDGIEEIRYRLSGEVVYVTPGEIAELLFDYRIRRPSAGFSDTGVLAFE